jgi:hypothetical protein
MKRTDDQTQTIGGYVVVTHLVSNGYHDHIVTHAFGDLRAAEKHVAGRRAKIDREAERYGDTETSLLNHEEYPTLHAVSPKLFEKAQEYLARINGPRDSRPLPNFGYDLGTAINRHTEKSEWSRVPYPYTYKVGTTEVLAAKSEWLAQGNRVEVEHAAKRPAAGRQAGGLISRFSSPEC